ncbi:MAG: hypothetical protein EXS09_17765 [Gemmataceae bacterium]|nr:hypothetical protein [Gemmataceae bacterium]
MSPLIVDGPFGDRLLAANNVTEVHDASGKLLGKFVPNSMPVVYVLDSPLPSNEDLARRMREERSYTAEEVMDRLRSIRERSQ